jgi:hypothetical protein
MKLIKNHQIADIPRLVKEKIPQLTRTPRVLARIPHLVHQTTKNPWHPRPQMICLQLFKALFEIKKGFLLLPFQSRSMPWYWKAKNANKLPIARPRVSADEVMYYQDVKLCNRNKKCDKIGVTLYFAHQPKKRRLTCTWKKYPRYMLLITQLKLRGAQTMPPNNNVGG